MRAMAEIHDFQERLAFSEGIQPGSELLTAVMSMVPNACTIKRATVSEDKSGTDYWITRSHGLPALSIDMKNRGYCPIERWSSDDACIETTSVYRGNGPQWQDDGRQKVGWTIDYSKRTDFVVYTWPNDQGTRFWIVPFVPLCAAARAHWREWAASYGERAAWNDGYRTLSVYPPRSVIAKAMRKFMAGVAPMEAA